MASSAIRSTPGSRRSRPVTTSRAIGMMPTTVVMAHAMSAASSWPDSFRTPPVTIPTIAAASQIRLVLNPLAAAADPRSAIIRSPV